MYSHRKINEQHCIYFFCRNFEFILEFWYSRLASSSVMALRCCQHNTHSTIPHCCQHNKHLTISHCRQHNKHHNDMLSSIITQRKTTDESYTSNGFDIITQHYLLRHLLCPISKYAVLITKYYYSSQPRMGIRPRLL